MVSDGYYYAVPLIGAALLLSWMTSPLWAQTLLFKQIAGLLARRIVFTKKVGDHVQRGERVGMIKFGSRVDVLLDASARVQIKVGDHVKGGASVLAYLAPESQQLASVGAAQTRQGAR